MALWNVTDLTGGEHLSTNLDCLTWRSAASFVTLSLSAINIFYVSGGLFSGNVIS